MSRSVLPSTGRKAARDDRRIIHKRQRARKLNGLTEYRRVADPDDVSPDFRGLARAVEVERQVREILAAGLHGTLNLELRRAAERQADWPASARPMPRRPLLGAHDAEAFADEMAGYREAVSVIAAVAATAGRAAAC